MTGKSMLKRQQCQVTNGSDEIPPLCAKCDQPIAERYLLKIFDLALHSTCLRCVECQSLLTDKCYVKADRFFCRNDFYRRFGVKCCGCSESISPLEVIRKAKDNFFHLRCFLCVLCRRQLNTGDEFYLMHDKKLVCRTDYEMIKARDFDGEKMSKRPRTTISPRQLETLKRAYIESKKPARHIREELSCETGLDMRVVQVWFQNRRAKEKRLEKDSGRRNAVASSSNMSLRWNEMSHHHQHQHHYHHMQQMLMSPSPASYADIIFREHQPISCLSNRHLLYSPSDNKSSYSAGGFELAHVSRRMRLSPAVGIHTNEPTSEDVTVASTAEARKAKPLDDEDADDVVVSSSTSTIFREDRRRQEDDSFDRCACCSSSKDPSSLTSNDDRFKLSGKHFAI